MNGTKDWFSTLDESFHYTIKLGNDTHIVRGKGRDVFFLVLVMNQNPTDYLILLKTGSLPTKMLFSNKECPGTGTKVKTQTTKRI